MPRINLPLEQKLNPRVFDISKITLMRGDAGQI